MICIGVWCRAMSTCPCLWGMAVPTSAEAFRDRPCPGPGRGCMQGRSSPQPHPRGSPLRGSQSKTPLDLGPGRALWEENVLSRSILTG